MLLFEIRQRSGRRSRRFYELRSVVVEAAGLSHAIRRLESYGRGDQWQSTVDRDFMRQVFIGVVDVKDSVIVIDRRVEEGWYGYVDDLKGVLVRFGLAMPRLRAARGSGRGALGVATKAAGTFK